MKAIVNQDTCIGCGLCVSLCEEVFTMNDDGLSEAIGEEIAADLVDTAEEACNCCPVDAIVIE